MIFRARGVLSFLVLGWGFEIMLRTAMLTCFDGRVGLDDDFERDCLLF